MMGSGSVGPGAVVLLLALVLALSGCAGSPATATVTAAATVTSAARATVPATGTPTATATAGATAIATATATPLPRTEPGATSPSGGGNADVVSVRAVEAANGTWTFHVTVRHPDTGWEDYADGWDVVTPDGRVLKPDPDSAFTRTLLHPHVDEQPFTRSQGGITIPQGVSQVRVRAHDLVDGWGGQEVVVDLEAGSGENFEVERQNERK
ncbi:MAG: hypothetical protein ACK2UY_17130 [Anaerolineae bacterium]